jgi:pimeloyl-ACP methyl ester carboxylesterase
VGRAVDAMPAPPVIVGHSMGGMIVQHHLLRRDDAPAAVLLAHVPPGGALGVSLRVGARHPAAFARTLLSGHLEPIVDDPGRARNLLASDRIPAGEWAKIQPTLLQDEAYLAYWDMVLFDLPKPRRLRTPLLVLGAGDDRLFTHAEVHQTAEAYGARMEILPDLSHDVMLDPGWRTAADRILAWLDERGV